MATEIQVVVWNCSPRRDSGGFVVYTVLHREEVTGASFHALERKAHVKAIPYDTGH